MKYKVTKIIDKVYLATFEEHYDLCMFFLRYQETYESPNPKFRNKPFKILDFMEWYSKDRKGCFTYPIDWGGFNLPSYIMDNVLDNNLLKNGWSTDANKYDYEMRALHSKLKNEVKGDYYLIGVSGESNNSKVIDHELAHGMYYTVPAYKKKMNALVKALSHDTTDKMNLWLKEIGYTKEVFVDETQAYLSTGLGEKFNKFAWKKLSKPFVKVFNEFKKDKVRNSSQG